MAKRSGTQAELLRENEFLKLEIKSLKGGLEQSAADGKQIATTRDSIVNNSIDESAFSALRQKAEDLLKGKPLKSNPELSDSDTLKLVHELQVHQVELEIQNDELLLAKNNADVLSKKYNVLYDFSPSGYFTFSRNGEVLDLNHHGSRMLGKTRTRLLKSSFGFFVSDDSKPIFNDFLDRVFSNENEETCEIVLSPNNSSPIYVHVTGIVSKHEKECLATFVDITEHIASEEKIKEANKKIDFQNQEKQKRADELTLTNEELVFQNQEKQKREDALILANKALAESEAKFSLFMEYLPVHTFIKDAESRLIYVNKAMDLILDASKWIGLEPEIIFDSETAARIREDDQKTIRSGYQVIEESFPSSDGLLHHYVTQKFVIPQSNAKPLIGGIGFDLTQRKQMEDALSLSEKQLNIAQQLGHTGSWVFNLETNTIWNSAEALKIFGYPPVAGDFSFNEFQSCLVEPELVNQALEDLIVKGIDYNIEFAINPVDGSLPRILHAIATIEKDSGGKTTKVLGFVQDITKKKQSEILVQQQNEQLRELNTTKDKFFSIIAHDLKGPFNGLLGLTGIMDTTISEMSLEEISKFSRLLRNSAVNLYKLLENLLEWARFQTGTINFIPKELCLSDVFLDAIESIEQRATQKGITLINEIPATQKIFADENMLNCILRNLVSNAIKFTRKDGSIIGRAREVENGMVEISVTDTGVGIRKDILETLFILGQKTGSYGTDDEPSTGLGLILCKDFVEKHSGKIWVESEEDKGSSFYFTVPKSE